MLRESQDYISGQQLCEQFQVSRTAVWKVIKQLQEEGYEVEAVRNRGYRLLSVPDILSREEIVSQMEYCLGGEKCLLLCRDRFYEYSGKKTGGSAGSSRNPGSSRTAKCRKGTKRKNLGISCGSEHLYITPPASEHHTGKSTDADTGHGVCGSNGDSGMYQFRCAD